MSLFLKVIVCLVYVGSTSSTWAAFDFPDGQGPGGGQAPGGGQGPGGNPSAGGGQGPGGNPSAGGGQGSGGGQGQPNGGQGTGDSPNQDQNNPPKKESFLGEIKDFLQENQTLLGVGTAGAGFMGTMLTSSFLNPTALGRLLPNLGRRTLQNRQLDDEEYMEAKRDERQERRAQKKAALRAEKKHPNIAAIREELSNAQQLAPRGLKGRLPLKKNREANQEATLSRLKAEHLRAQPDLEAQVGQTTKGLKAVLNKIERVEQKSKLQDAQPSTSQTALSPGRIDPKVVKIAARKEKLTRLNQDALELVARQKSGQKALEYQQKFLTTGKHPTPPRDQPADSIEVRAYHKYVKMHQEAEQRVRAHEDLPKNQRKLLAQEPLKVPTLSKTQTLEVSALERQLIKTKVPKKPNTSKDKRQLSRRQSSQWRLSGEGSDFAAGAAKASDKSSRRSKGQSRSSTSKG